MAIILPSILTNNPEEAIKMLRSCETAGVDRVSIDVVDGVFTQNKSFDIQILFDFETSLLFDFQLMVKEPAGWVEKCIRAQADRIIGHVEIMTDQAEFIRKAQSGGVKAGLALDIDTPCDNIKWDTLKEIDVLLLMNYKAGIGGKPFDQKVVEKVKYFVDARVKSENLFKIQSDGAVWTDNIGMLSALGVDEFSVGRKIFEGDLQLNIESLLKITK